MNIHYINKKVKNRLTQSNHLFKEYGRLAKPVSCLISKIKGLKRNELFRLPGFHELKEQAKGIYAVTVKHPYRLVMKISDSQNVIILDVVDYHGKNNMINNYKKINYYA